MRTPVFTALALSALSMLALPQSAEACPQERVAWLSSTTTNLYDQTNLEGAMDIASWMGAEVVPFYSNFDVNVQLTQCFEIVNSGDYDAIVVQPATSTGLLPCVAAAGAAGIPVVASDLHLGDDPTSGEIQVPGQTGAVLVPPSEVGPAFADIALDRCEGVNPCEIVLIGGLFALVNDQLTLEALEDLADNSPNIVLTEIEEGFYSSDVAYGIMSQILADGGTPDIVFNGGDQMAMGVEMAIADAGLPEGSIDIVGGGAGEYGVQAIEDGRWYATFVTLPYDAGFLATKMAIKQARGWYVSDTGINPVTRRNFPYMLTQDNLNEEFGCFYPQWPG